MDDIRERVHGFLAEFTSPDEEDIQNFIEDIAAKNPSLDIENFRKKLIKVIRQGEQIKLYENEFSSLSVGSPIYNELKSILKEAKEGHGNLEDISGELKNAKKLLASLKGNKRKETESENEKVGDAALKLEEQLEEDLDTTEITSGDEDESPREPSKKPGRRSKKEKLKKPEEERVQPEEERVQIERTEKTCELVKTGIPEEIAEKPKENLQISVVRTEPAEVQKEEREGEGISQQPEQVTEEKTEEEETETAESETEPEEKIESSEEEETEASEEGTRFAKKETDMPAVQQETGKSEEISQQFPVKIPEEKIEKPKEQELTGKKDEILQKPKEDKTSKKEIEPSDVEEESAEDDIEDEDTEVSSTGDSSAKEGEINSKKKEDALESRVSLEGAEDLLRRLNMDNTKDVLKNQFTPEKQAVFELLEEKLMTDVETRIKKLKEIQTNVLEEKPPQTVLEKVKTFLTKETESIETYDIALHGPLVTFEGLEGLNEIERYWVNEPYAFVVILFDPENNTHLYYVAEPILSDFEDLFLREIKDRLKDVLLVEDVKNEEDKDKILTGKVKQLVKDYAIDITPLTLEKVLYYTRRDFIKFGKIDPLMHDNRIEDISANGHDIPIYLYHKKYTNIPTNIYYNENELNSYVIRLAQRCGKHISIAEPMVDATMPDGSRIQMTLGTEVTSHGATFTIRKFSEIPITPVDLINWNTFSAEEMAYLWLCIENNKSLIYAGGTASGKTSSLNAVSLFIPAQAKIVTLEDTRELKLPHPNWIPGVTRDSFTADGRGGIDMYELLRAALRQRPEYLLVGEVRGKEALTLFQAMSTGHTTFSTMHADSVASAIHRLENPPISVPRTMIQALNIISIQSQTYVKGKRARRNMKLVEITDIDPTTRNIRTNDIFVWDPLTDKFIRAGESKALNEIMIRRGWSLEDLKKELMNRQKILEFMVNNKITDFNAISTIIHDYQATPEKVLTKLNING